MSKTGESGAMKGKKQGGVLHEFDILAAVVSRCQNGDTTTEQLAAGSPDYRVSCHRCGNIRKRRQQCSAPSCPHTYCGRCSEKMKEEFGPEVFENGCPVCKFLCCCSNKSVTCNRQNHCYRKCPYTKSAAYRSSASTTSTPTRRGVAEKRLGNRSKSSSSMSSSLDASSFRSEGGISGSIFDLLAAMADIDRQQASCIPCSTASSAYRPGAFSDVESGDEGESDFMSSPMKKRRMDARSQQPAVLKSPASVTTPNYSTYFKLPSSTPPPSHTYFPASYYPTTQSSEDEARYDTADDSVSTTTDPITAASAMNLLALARVTTQH